MHLLLLFLLLPGFWIAGTVAALADERILDFDSAVVVEPDGGLQVRETLRVRAEGRSIRHGIYRDLPLRYRTLLGLYRRVGFSLAQVLLDGQPVAWHTKTQRNGIRIYIGQQNRLLNPGIHTYTLVYRTDRQLGVFSDHDELYWNVTGTDWKFPIDHARATVTLPDGVPRDAIRVEGYTGPQGAKGQDYTAKVTTEGLAEFATTRPLPPHTGLTIVVSWPKGFVREPSRETRLGWWLEDNRSALIAGGGLILLLGYFLIAWYRVGRDPEAGVIIPRYSPPDGLSPAAMRFVRNMGYDNKTFAAALVGLAAKGYCTIDEQDGDYTLTRLDAESPPSLTTSEAALNQALQSWPRHFRFRQENHAEIQTVRKTHEKALRREYAARNFRLNATYLWIGVALLVVSYATALLTLPDTEDKSLGLFLSLWLTIWSFGVYMLVARAIGAWRQVGSPGGNFLNLLGALGATLFALPFIGGEVFGIVMLVRGIGILVALLLVSGIGLILLFHHLLKAPTLLGRRLLDRIEGFRLYLSVAEASDLKMTYSPRVDRQMFETYLPYAMALDVEDAWTRRFAQSLRDSGTSPDTYAGPAWYGGYLGGNALSGLSSGFSSAMSNAIAAAATPPGSSSGSGGGGSSGGGGGGGGGGGW
ncbi:hypothetical protein A9404_07975 [Halothiobacillus diazotrophicus]|uniref:DUF2207 domain-containing protein n=1 Tax=Halothiobacillus diazotrophicus TaxID=1860122 RepID=A0A191ZKI9_9GAMM|nr:hypothetical protein A9404_07975 [Halothiobacillus diazotrophicus]